MIWIKTKTYVSKKQSCLELGTQKKKLKDYALLKGIVKHDLWIRHFLLRGFV